MENKKTSTFSCAMIWFGAAVSIAEIITGTYFAPLGFAKGLTAIVIGHVIGCVLLFFAGYIGGLSQKSSMETTKYSFGIIGSKFFALLNIIQLIGWTGIMIYDGALAINEIFDKGKWIWCLVIGALIIVWVLIGIKNIAKINVVAMSLLFALTLVLFKIILAGDNNASPTLSENISFGAAIELAVAMPLSWLPLISDYTKDSQKPFKATLVSSITYGLTSTWMYVIGMGAAIFTGEGDIAKIAVKAGVGIVGLIIIIISTVSTTFLDAVSVGISLKTIIPKENEKLTGIATTIIGTIGAIIFNMDNISNFLYFIGSVFVPMIAILIADFFVIKNDSSEKKIDIPKLIIWLIGFIFYRLFMKIDFVLGCSLIDMIFSFLIYVIFAKIKTLKK